MAWKPTHIVKYQGTELRYMGRCSCGPSHNTCSLVEYASKDGKRHFLEDSLVQKIKVESLKTKLIQRF